MRIVPLLVLVLALSADLAVSQPAPPGTFEGSVDVRVVNVEAVVTDARGERVRGLTAADFRLRVDGREVAVDLFSEIAEGRTAGPGQEAPAGRSFLVFIDEAFSIAPQRDAVLRRMAEDLPLLGAEDRMAVLAFDGSRVDVLSGWTGDRALLRAALERAVQRPARGNRSLSQHRSLQRDAGFIDESNLEEVADLATIFEMLGKRVSPEVYAQLVPSMEAAAGAVRGFEAPAGRKVLMLLTGGWSIGDGPQQYAALVSAANRVGYTFYPVDVAMPDHRSLAALNAFAAATGGKVANTARLDALRQVVEDTCSYYLLGFTPDWPADGRHRRVVVEARRPGLTVRSRGTLSNLSPQTRNAMRAEGILRFGGAPEDRHLRVEVGEPLRSDARTMEVPVTVQVPIGSLALVSSGSGYTAEVPIAAAALDEEGRRAELPGLRLRITLAEPPPPGGYARSRSVLKLRRIPQNLVFTTPDQINGVILWGEAEVRPPVSRPEKEKP